MDLNTLQKKLSENNLLIFTPLDLQRFLGVSKQAAQKTLTRYTDREIFTKLRRGYYALSENLPHTYYVANYIYQPSYISLESALSYYQIIPDSIHAVISVTPRATQSFEALSKEFTYTKIKKKAFTGYRKQQINDSRVLIAEPEKAVADYLYLVSLGNKELLDRFNIEKLSREKLINYVEIFERKSMKELIKKL